MENRIEEITVGEVKAKIPERSRDAHKGDFGHILVAGGSAGFGGAPALSALAALRSGSGLVTAALPTSLVNGPIAAMVPEAMVHPIEEDSGHMVGNAFLTWLFGRKRFDAIAIGPGLGQSPDTAAIVAALLKMHDVPLVLDADALNLIAATAEGLRGVREASEGGVRVLTPHHAEAARLLRSTTAEVAADRCGAVRRLADESGAIAVLKGRETLIATPDSGIIAVCRAGNPGMATGGSGDVLTGVIASLIGQGLGAADATRVGVWLHATAGDVAAARYGERAMIARDIIDALPEAAAKAGCR